MENNNFKPFPFEQLKQKKEPEKTAVAIAYEPGEKAPKILATGKGQVAEKIIEKAKESQVPTYKDNKLASTLSKLQIGDMIPPSMTTFTGSKTAIIRGRFIFRSSRMQYSSIA